MSKRDRQRRTANQRAGRGHGPRAGSGRTGDGNGPRASGAEHAPPLPPPEALAAQIQAAATDHAKGDQRAATTCAAELMSERFGVHARLVDSAIGIAFCRVIGTAWQAGWLPCDLHQHVRRRLGKLAVTLVTDAITAEMKQYSPGTVHKRWRDQLTRIEAVSWWAADHPHFGQWAQRHQCPRDEALTLVVEVLAILLTVPQLPRILPPPGTAPPASASSSPGSRTEGVDERVLTRVRALLAKAEATAFSEEAEALSAKAQEFMNRYALERAVVDAQESTAASADARRLWLDNPYLGAKAMLVDVVASANRCRAVFYEDLGFVTVLGDNVDLDIVEMLTTSLLVQATTAMLAAGQQTDRYGRSRTRSYRQSFLLAYATRIGERLREATDTEEAAAADPRLLPVLASREQAVDELFAEMFSKTVPKSYSVSNRAGWGAGRAAAEIARLGTDRTAVEGRVG